MNTGMFKKIVWRLIDILCVAAIGFGAFYVTSQLGRHWDKVDFTAMLKAPGFQTSELQRFRTSDLLEEVQR